MKTLTRVLLLGCEARLLEPRSVVLTHFWAVSTALAQWTDKDVLRTVAKADVVVLSNDLPEELRHRWIEEIREHSPEKVLIQMDELDRGPVGGLDAMVAVGSGPGALVATIYGLLCERGMASKGWKSLETTLLDDVSGPVH